MNLLLCIHQSTPLEIGNALLPVSLLASLVGFCANATAQIIPDSTLPNHSTVTVEDTLQRISGGTEAGGNLFHSFREFNVPTGGTAYFDNALTIDNIITRVTGGNVSSIDGLIRANGTANLFLINPAGIAVGENAQLDLGGSFFGSTAESVMFEDGSFYSATEPNTSPLLSINVPIGLQFGENPGSIVNRSSAPSAFNSPVPDIPFPLPPDLNFAQVGLEVRPGQTLALIGGNIQLAGGNLTASGGQIYLGSVAGESLVTFAPTPLGWRFEESNIANAGNISLSDGSLVNTSGLGSGKVEIAGENVTVSDSRIFALTLGNLDGRGIDIRARQLQVGEGSKLSTLTLGDGGGGDIDLQTTEGVELNGVGLEGYRRLVGIYSVLGTFDPFDEQIVLSTGTVGTGNAGDIAIETGNLRLRNGAIGVSATAGEGNAGNLTVRANTVELVRSAINNGTARASQEVGGDTGMGGDIIIETAQLTLRDEAILASITPSNADAGDIAISATESVELFGSLTGAIVQTSIVTDALDINGNGSAGDITIDTKRLSLSGGATISSDNGSVGNLLVPDSGGSGRNVTIRASESVSSDNGMSFGNLLVPDGGGSGGNVTIRASESVEIVGISEEFVFGARRASVISANTLNSSSGGNVEISTPVLTVLDGGNISAASLNDGDAGDITIDANRVEVGGRGENGQFVSTIEVSVGTLGSTLNFLGSVNDANATGNGGELNLNADRLTVRDGARVTGLALGTGSAGDLNITAGELVLENQGSINASTSSGLGGNLNLQAQDIQLRQQSRIETNAGNSTGGNIAIETETLAALENSDISANSTGSRGGNITVDAIGIFGTEFRLFPTSESDITATGITQQDAGTVALNTPDVDTAAGLVNLPNNVTDPSALVTSSCAAYADSQFTVTGRGGLSEEPMAMIRGQTIWEDWQDFGETSATSTSNDPVSVALEPPVAPLVEATGWITYEDGRVELVAHHSPNFSLESPECRDLNSELGVRSLERGDGDKGTRGKSVATDPLSTIR